MQMAVAPMTASSGANRALLQRALNQVSESVVEDVAWGFGDQDADAGGEVEEHEDQRLLLGGEGRRAAARVGTALGRAEVALRVVVVADAAHVGAAGGVAGV